MRHQEVHGRVTLERVRQDQMRGFVREEDRERFALLLRRKGIWVEVGSDRIRFGQRLRDARWPRKEGRESARVVADRGGRRGWERRIAENLLEEP